MNGSGRAERVRPESIRVERSQGSPTGLGAARWQLVARRSALYRY